MFATKQDLNKGSFRPKPPKQEVYEHLQVKKGVFPYAIRANPVSKQEIFGKDQRKADPVDKDNSHVFQKPKNTLFDKKVANEKPRSENPSMSTGFFESTQHHPTTPRNSKNPRDDDVTFSTCSNTTEKNKLVLLNHYLTAQYNAVLEAKAASTDEPKYINFNAEDAFQICAYKQIGEVLNQSFVEKSCEFKCSLNKTASIQRALRKLYSERKNKERRSSRKSHTEVAKNASDDNESPHERIRSSENAAIADIELPDKKHPDDGIKSDVKNGNFRLKDPVLKTDALSNRKANKTTDQSNVTNADLRSPQRNMPENPARNLTSPPPANSRNFIREFEIRKYDSFIGKLAECDAIYKKSPLFPNQHENSKPEFKPVDTPTLFFSETDSSVSPEVDKKDTRVPPKNNFALDSAVFTRKFSPELFNPIDMIGACAESPKVKKQTIRRKKAIASLSDSSRHRVPFKRYKECERDEFASKRDNYSKFNLKNEKFNLF